MPSDSTRIWGLEWPLATTFGAIANSLVACHFWDTGRMICKHINIYKVKETTAKEKRTKRCIWNQVIRFVIIDSICWAA